MADLTFRWASNLDKVAGEIDRDLNRISQSVKKVGRGTGDLGQVLAGDLGGGLQRQIQSINVEARRAIQTAGVDLQKQFSRLGKDAAQGGRIDVQSAILGGGAQDPKNVFNQVNERFRNLSKQLDLAIQGTPLEGQREQLQAQLQRAGARVVRNMQELYATIARDLDKVRQQVGGIPGTTIARDVRADVQGRAAQATVLPGVEGSRAQRDAALRSFLGEADVPKEEQSRLVNAIEKASRAEEESQAIQRQLIAELRANRVGEVGSRLRDPSGARIERVRGEEIFIDREGRQFSRGEEGLFGRRQPLAEPVEEEAVQAEIERRRRAEIIRRQAIQDDAEEQVRNTQRTRSAEEQRRQALLQLSAALRADAARPGGAARAGNFVRDRSGGLFKFTDQGEGIAPIPAGTSKDRLAAQDALRRRDQQIIKAKERELAAQERISARTAQRAGGAGGGGGRIDHFFRRVRGEGGGGGFGGRGLGFDDILSSGLSFSRYLISAAAFGAVFAILAQVKEALLDYEDSLTDLSVALGGTEKAQQSFTDELAGISRFTGENPGAALDSAARGIRAFTNSLDSLEEKEGVGSDFADAAQELAVISSKSLQDASGDIIAITNVFEASFDRINDAIASAKQTSGADPSEIAQGMASIGTAAREAGFDLEETASLISVVIARTDQSGRAAATRLSRALSITGGSAGQSAIAQLNSQLKDPDFTIDQSGSVREQLEQLADVYPQLTSAQQAFIRNSAGGAANQREFLTVLTEFDEILRATQQSYEGSGEAAKEFNRRANDLRGQVLQIQGSLKNIIVQLSGAGVFDVFIGAVRAIEPLLSAVEQLLQLYNSLPRTLKSLIALTLQYAAAQALLNRYKAAGVATTGIELSQEAALTSVRTAGTTAGMRGGLGGPIVFPSGTFDPTRVARNPNLLGRQSVGSLVGGVGGGLGLRSVGPAIAAEATAGIKNAFTRLGNFLATPTGLALLGIGGILAISRTASQSQQANEALNAADFGAIDFDTDLRDQISARQEQAEQLRQASSGFFGNIVNFFRGFELSDAAGRLEDSAEGLGEAAESFDERIKNSLRQGSDADLIDLGTAEGISEGLKTLEENGRSAESRLNSLREAVSNLGEAAAQAENTLTGRDRVEFEEFLGQGIEQQLAQEEDLQKGIGGRLFVRLFNRDQARASIFGENLEDRNIDMDRINDVTQRFLEQTGGELTREDQASLAELLFPIVAEGIEDFDDLLPEEQEQVRRLVEAAVRNTKGNVQDAVDDYVQISQFIASSIDEIGAASKEISQRASLVGDPRGGELAGAQFTVEELRTTLNTARAKGAAPEQVQQLEIELGAAELELQQALRNRIQAQSELAQSELADSLDVERLRIDIDRVRGELRIATDRNEVDALNAELNGLQRQLGDLLLARTQAARAASIDPRDSGGQAREAVRVAREAVRQLRSRGDESSATFFQAIGELRDAQQGVADFELQLAQAHRLSHVDPRDTIGQARAELQNSIDELENQLRGTPEYYEALRSVREAQLSLAEEEVNLAAAQRGLNVDPRSDVDQARVELANVRDRLRNTLSGTTEYFETLRELRDAQIAFTESVLEAESLARQVDIDLTDPVATTAEALLTARRSLAAAVSEGAPEDVLNQLRIEEQNAQAQAEAAAFQQRFQDARTARDLGRISHAEYLAYLNEEHARLESIHDRTRQQQEQLDQVEQALKAARESMDAQFNLGDIDIPTPFEARRSVQEQLGSRFASSSSMVINEGDTTIMIDGADLAAVRKIIEDSIGTTAVRRLSGSGRRS